MRRVVKVTQADIARGVQDNCMECPIALAIIKAFPVCAHLHIEVMIDCVRIAEPFDVDSLEVKLPRTVSAFIASFDNGRPVEPFEFAISETNFLEAARRWPSPEAAA